MAAFSLRLDHGGMAEMLTSAPVAAVIQGYAETTAGHARSNPAVTRHGVPVEVRSYVTDRAACAVTLAHPVGMALQAKYGVLTQAAGAAGLEVGGGGGGDDLVDYVTKSGKKRKATRKQAAAWAASRK